VRLADPSSANARKVANTPLVDTRAELMELAVAWGLKILITMFEEDRAATARARAFFIGRNG
jgi:hypothetical protein